MLARFVSIDPDAAAAVPMNPSVHDQAHETGTGEGVGCPDIGKRQPPRSSFSPCSGLWNMMRHHCAGYLLWHRSQEGTGREEGTVPQKEAAS
eukprot:1289397-Pyramimonas_sp.AAC.1